MTSVRLAYGGPVQALARALGPGEVTTVRLARGNQNTRGVKAIGDASKDTMTTVRVVGGSGSNKSRGTYALERQPVTDVRLVGARMSNKDIAAAMEAGPGRRQPALLVSFAYWRQFSKERARYSFRDYSLDSGAYTVEHSGGTVDLGQYIEFCQDRLRNDPQCVEVFALDVISDWRASQKNVERMWKAGVPAIPVYHRGEPEALLVDLAKSYPKIALGGCSHLIGPAKLAWASQCFARIWPARVHGLAVCGEPLLMALPFHSVDASSWEMGPAAFGNYRSMAKPYRAPRGGKINLRAELEWYLDLEQRVAGRWKGELAKLEKARSKWPLRKAGKMPVGV